MFCVGLLLLVFVIFEFVGSERAFKSVYCSHTSHLSLRGGEKLKLNTLLTIISLFVTLHRWNVFVIVIVKTQVTFCTFCQHWGLDRSTVSCSNSTSTVRLVSGKVGLLMWAITRTLTALESVQHLTCFPRRSCSCCFDVYTISDWKYIILLALMSSVVK